MFHRSDVGACFADPHKNYAPSESKGYALADFKVRKELGIECWCVAFTSDPEQASAIILKHGDCTALRRGIEEALARGDVENAQRLRTRLIRETSEANRDARWLDDVSQRISSLLQSRSRNAAQIKETVPQSRAHEKPVAVLSNDVRLGRRRAKLVAKLSGSPLLRRYRSAIRRAILIQLTQKPDATDIEVCRALDADGGVELLESWKRKPEDRLFVEVYLDPRRRNKIESLISKVRADLSKSGLL